MQKQNEARENITLCDRCSKPATVFHYFEAFCTEHAELTKSASQDEPPLKSCAPKLAPKYTK